VSTWRGARWTACGWLAALWLAPVHAADPLATLDADVRACIERSLPRESMVQDHSVVMRGSGGWERRARWRVYWQRAPDGGANVLFVVTEPKAEAGLKVLVQQPRAGAPAVYVYLPDLRRVRRVVGAGASSSVLGTDFSLDDALLARTLVDRGRTRRLSDETHAGRALYVLAAEADSGPWTRIETRIDQASCLPLDTRFFTANGTLGKTLSIDPADVELIAGHGVPRRLRAANHLQGSSTEIAVDTVEVDVALPAELFTLAELEKSH